MNLFKHEINVASPQKMVKITGYVKEDLKKCKMKSGIAVVFCPHTTAGITINENADPDVQRDLIYGYEKVFPTNDENYRHFEGNSHAHMKSSAMGASAVVIVEEGKLILGTWQDIYFCEYDGPRYRKFFVKFIEG
ncbi:MAG: secondary thiamine-phosphate synthase enzyme YjbQ [Ruminococcus sp.]